MAYQITVPEITAAAIEPNPCDMNRKFILTVEVIEKTIVLQPEIWYAGELHSGEV